MNRLFVSWIYLATCMQPAVLSAVQSHFLSPPYSPWSQCVLSDHTRDAQKGFFFQMKWSAISCFSWLCSLSMPNHKCFILHQLHRLKKIARLNLNMYNMTARHSIWKHFRHWNLMLLSLKFPFSFAEGFIWGAPSYIRASWKRVSLLWKMGQDRRTASESVVR